MVTLEILKQNLRIEDNFDDNLLTINLNAASKYVTGVTGIENDTNAPAEYKMCVILIASTYYTNRESFTSNAVNRIPYGVSALMQNLRKGGDLI